MDPGPSDKGPCGQCRAYYDTMVKAMLLIERTAVDHKETTEDVRELKITGKLIETEKKLLQHKAAMIELKGKILRSKGRQLKELRQLFLGLKTAFVDSIGREIDDLKTLTEAEEKLLASKREKLGEFKVAISDLESVMQSVHSSAK